MGYTGGGYERWRSKEYRPESPRDGKEDVYVYHHRLLAVVACYDPSMRIEDVLADIRGSDVHHESGCPFDNRPGNLAVLDHGEHSSTTQAQKRAWAEDAKREADEQSVEASDVCAGCGAESEFLATSEGFEGARCLECAKRDAEGHSIEVGA